MKKDSVDNIYINDYLMEITKIDKEFVEGKVIGNLEQKKDTLGTLVLYLELCEKWDVLLIKKNMKKML